MVNAGSDAEMRVVHVQFNVIVGDNLQQGRDHALLGAQLQISRVCQAGGHCIDRSDAADLANLELAALLDIWI